MLFQRSVDEDESYCSRPADRDDPGYRSGGKQKEHLGGERLYVDRGYHYIDMGKIDSGYNNYANMRGLKDEQMKAHIVSNEFTQGMCYVF